MAGHGVGSGTWEVGCSPMELLTALGTADKSGKASKGGKKRKKRGRAGGTNVASIADGSVADGHENSATCMAPAASSREAWPADVDELVELVARPSGAAGKQDEERMRLACRWVLKKYREGALGSLTLDDVR